MCCTAPSTSHSTCCCGPGRPVGLNGTDGTVDQQIEQDGTGSTEKPQFGQKGTNGTESQQFDQDVRPRTVPYRRYNNNEKCFSTPWYHTNEEDGTESADNFYSNLVQYEPTAITLQYKSASKGLQYDPTSEPLQYTTTSKTLPYDIEDLPHSSTPPSYSKLKNNTYVNQHTTDGTEDQTQDTTITELERQILLQKKRRLQRELRRIAKKEKKERKLYAPQKPPRGMKRRRKPAPTLSRFNSYFYILLLLFMIFTSSCCHVLETGSQNGLAGLHSGPSGIGSMKNGPISTRSMRNNFGSNGPYGTHSAYSTKKTFEAKDAYSNADGTGDPTSLGSTKNQQSVGDLQQKSPKTSGIPEKGDIIYKTRLKAILAKLPEAENGVQHSPNLLLQNPRDQDSTSSPLSTIQPVEDGALGEKSTKSKRTVQQIGHLDENGRIVVDMKVDTPKLFETPEGVNLKNGPVRLDSAAAAALLSNDPEALARLAKISGKAVDQLSGSESTSKPKLGNGFVNNGQKNGGSDDKKKVDEKSTGREKLAENAAESGENGQKLEKNAKNDDKSAGIDDKNSESASEYEKVVDLPTDYDLKSNESNNADEESTDEHQDIDIFGFSKPSYSIYFNRTVHINNITHADVISEGIFEFYKLNSTVKSLGLVCSISFEGLKMVENTTAKVFWTDLQSMTRLSNTSTYNVNGSDMENVINTGIRPACTAVMSLENMDEEVTVYSRSLTFQAFRPSEIKIWPKKVSAKKFAKVRLECAHNYSDVEDIFWWHNEKAVNLSDERFDIYSNPLAVSVLFIQEIEQKHIGLYECGIRLKNNVTVKGYEMAEVTVQRHGHDTIIPQEPVAAPDTVEVREGAPLFLECWDDRVDSVWYRIGANGKEMVSNSSVLQIESVESGDKGIYECFQTDGNDTTHIFKTNIIVKPQLFEYEVEDFTLIQKNQGTPVKIMCETHPSLDETPSMAKWYKNGQEITERERVYKRVEDIEDGLVIGKALFISLAQKNDEGMYECVIRKDKAQRVQHNLLQVKKSTELELKNLKMLVDHPSATFHAHFDLPEPLQYWDGLVSTYFLVYHTADGQRALNVIPKHGAKCTEDNHCTMEVRPPNPLDVATDYTFRISMVLNEKLSVITPLSAPVNATSWDGVARSSLELMWGFKDEHLEIKWSKPKVQGELKDYHMDLFNLSPALNLEDGAAEVASREKGQLQRFRVLIPANKTSYQLDIPAPFAFKVRIIPRTRSLLPSPYKLESVRDFGYTLIVVNENQPFEVDWSIPAPKPRIYQIGAEPKLKLRFKELPKKDDRTTTSIRVHYRPLSNLYQDENKESNEVIDSEVDTNHSTVAEFTNNVMTLTEGLKVGTVYQVCSAYEKRENLDVPKDGNAGTVGQNDRNTVANNIHNAVEHGTVNNTNTTSFNSTIPANTPTTTSSNSSAVKTANSTNPTVLPTNSTDLALPTVPKIGLWHCQNVPLLDQKGRVRQLKADDSFSPTAKREPNPIDCAKFGYCRCVQSRDDMSMMLVRWPREAVGDHADVGGFILHYTYDGPEDPEVKKKNAQLFTDGNDTVTYIQNLFPSFTYRVSINVYNSDLQEYPGTEFRCKTPESLPIPPPIGINITQLSDHVLQVSWRPPIPKKLLNKVKTFDGYNVHWKKVGQREGAGSFVHGHDVNNHILTTEAEDEYVVSITSHSSASGESPVRSETVSAVARPKSVPDHHIQKDLYQDVWGDNIKVKQYREEDHIPKFYQNAHFREWVLIILVTLLTIAIFGTIFMIVYVQCGDRLFGKNRDGDLSSLSSGRRSSVGSIQSIHAITGPGGNAFGFIGLAHHLEMQQLLNDPEYEPPQLSSQNTLLDTKGPVGGRLKKKTNKLMSDPGLAKRLMDLNHDPTGLGKSFEEVLEDIAREQEEMMERRRLSGQSDPHSPHGKGSGHKNEGGTTGTDKNHNGTTNSQKKDNGTNVDEKNENNHKNGSTGTNGTKNHQNEPSGLLDKNTRTNGSTSPNGTKNDQKQPMDNSHKNSNSAKKSTGKSTQNNRKSSEDATNESEKQSLLNEDQQDDNDKDSEKKSTKKPDINLDSEGKVDVNIDSHRKPELSTDSKTLSSSYTDLKPRSKSILVKPTSKTSGKANGYQGIALKSSTTSLPNKFIQVDIQVVDETDHGEHEEDSKGLSSDVNDIKNGSKSLQSLGNEPKVEENGRKSDENRPKGDESTSKSDEDAPTSHENQNINQLKDQNELVTSPQNQQKSTTSLQNTQDPTTTSQTQPQTTLRAHEPSTITKSNSLVGFSNPSLTDPQLSQDMSSSDGNICPPITSSQLFKRPALSFDSFPEDEHKALPQDSLSHNVTFDDMPHRNTHYDNVNQHNINYDNMNQHNINYDNIVHPHLTYNNINHVILKSQNNNLEPVERRRLKTGLEPEIPNNNAVHTSSMPNLADSGIVYDDCGNHIGIMIPLHTINSEKILRNFDLERRCRLDKHQTSDNETETSSSAASSRGSDQSEPLGPVTLLSPTDAYHALGSRTYLKDTEYDDNAIEMREFKIEPV
ncbi:unnamed protein product [Bursaphelenchus okinawaensis]|uniref:Uncharacterized protein n=1 Tax=Bursaphelenchus okinawaensis TaxID=465554 RepID=A0A811JXH5_9BILA|nr:unnamed protein product [Bursaphelenchus okinawaensis]CAG9086506.1 unnamed protein product [Bursaphelenchus okinawaensis]